MPPKLASDVVNKLARSMINFITIIPNQINSYDEFNKHKFIAPTCGDLVRFYIEHSKAERDQIQLFKKYAANIHFKPSHGGDYTEIVYKQSSKSKLILGRFYNNPHTSLVPLCKIFKHTIFKFLNYTDLDMVSGHASIMVSVAEKNNIPCLHVKRYITNKDEVLIELIAYYPEIDKTDIKFLFNIILYGGNYNTWTAKLAEGDDGSNYDVKNPVNPKKIAQNKPIHPFIIEFESECKNFKKRVIEANQSLFQTMIDNYEIKMSQWDYENAFLSCFFQFIENHTIWLSYLFLVEHKYIKANRVVLEYDGLCVPKPCEGYKEIDEFAISALNEFLISMTGLEYIKLSIKPYVPDQTILDVYYQLMSDKSYETVKEIFEYNYNGKNEHFKVKNIPIFIRAVKKDIICDEPDLSYFTKDDMIMAYGEEIYIDANGKEHSFIEKWLKDKTLRYYQSINSFPNSLLCPPDVYNMWITFCMEKIDNYVPNSDFEILRDHIKNIICNRDMPLFNYFESWIASCIQHPEKKLKCPVIIGDKGSGKTTLIDILREMFGTKILLESTKPSRDVYGQFNNCLESAYIVVLSELKQGELATFDSEIKGLITDKTLQLSCKGKNVKNIKSYHRFMIVTNARDPVGITDDERRYFYINTSAEKCPQTADNSMYFKRIHAAIESIDIIKSLYEYYKNYNIDEDFYLLPPPVSKEEQMCKLANKSPISQYLKHKLDSYPVKQIADIDNNTLFIGYNDFRKQNNIEESITQSKFGLKVCQDELSMFIGIRSAGHGTKYLNIYMYFDYNFMKTTKMISKEYFNKKYDNWTEKIKELGKDQYIRYLIQYDADIK